MKHKITAKQFEMAQRLAACKDGLAAAKSMKTWEALAGGFPEHALWGARLMPKERWAKELIDYCARREPLAALTHAAKYLAPSRLDDCARRKPYAALQFAPEYLTPACLDDCARREPYTALAHAKYLTPSRLDDCARREPLAALQFATKYLTPSRLDDCARRKPYAALQFAPEYLTFRRRIMFKLARWLRA